MAQYKDNIQKSKNIYIQKSVALLLVRNRLQITEIIQIGINRK